MGQEPGSGSSASKIEGTSGGGSTSVSVRGEGKRDSGTSLNLNTTTELVDGSKSTDDSNTVSDVSGLLTTEAEEDTDSKDDHTSGQAGPSFVAVSTGNDDIQQPPEEWTIVNSENSDADAVKKGEGCTQNGKTDTETGKVPVVAKVGGTEVQCTTDAKEVHAQIKIEGFTEDPRASSQGTQSSRAAVALPDVADFRTQGAWVLIKSGSANEARQQPFSLRQTKSLRDKLETVSPSNIQRVTSTGAVVPSTGIVSGSQKESKPNSEAASTASTAEAPVEPDISQGDPSSVSASGAHEEISEASKAPITVMLDSGAQEEISAASKAPITVRLDSGPQEEPGSCVGLPRTESPREAVTSLKVVSKVSHSGTQEESNDIVEPLNTPVLDFGTQEAVSCRGLAREMSRSKTRKAVFTIPEAAGPMSGSVAQGGSSVTLEASCSVPASGAICVVSDSMGQDDVHSLPEVLPPSEMNGGSVETEVLPTESSCEVSKDVDSTSSDSPNTVGIPVEIRNNRSTDSVVRNEVGIPADPPIRVCEGEVSGVSIPLSTVPSLKVQESFGTNPEENVPRAEDLSKLRPPESFGTDPEENLPRTEHLSKLRAPECFGTSSEENVPRAEDLSKLRAPESFGTNLEKNVSRAEAPSKVSGRESFGTKPEENVPRAEDLSKLRPPESFRTDPEENVPRAEDLSKLPAPESFGTNSEENVPRTEHLSMLRAPESFGTNLEKNVSRAEAPSKVSGRESLRRTASQAGEESLRHPLQMSAQQCETTVSDILESRSRRPLSAGGELSVPEGDAAGSDHLLSSSFLYEEQLAKKDEELAQKDKTITKLNTTISTRELVLRRNRGMLQAVEQNFDGEVRKNAELLKRIHDLEMELHAERKYGIRCTAHIKDLEGQLERTKKDCDTVKKECGTLQEQLSLYEQQHANEQSRGGSYLDDTKAATPALLVSALNGVKDASNNFVKVLKSSIQPGIEDGLRNLIGAVSRNGHIKFQYQAYVCRVLFHGFEHPYSGVSRALLPPTTYFRHYKLHDMKKTDTVDRLLRYDPAIDPSLHDFCVDKFLKLMENIQHLLIDKSVDLRQLVQTKQHQCESKLYVSFCKLAVSVWLLQRLAFSFLQPAKEFIAHRGAPFDQSRMQSVVPLDEPSGDEEVQLRVGFCVLPGFDVGNSAVPCEVYVTAL